MTLAHVFLLVSGVFFLIVFALPLLIAPKLWAKIFRWPDAESASPLTLYFGRCLGATATALTCVTLWYAGSPPHQVLLLDLIALAGLILIGIHVWGALRRTQPWTEDVEIVLYAGATMVALYARFTL